MEDQAVRKRTVLCASNQDLLGGGYSGKQEGADTFDDELEAIMEKHLSKIDTFLPKKKVQNTPEPSKRVL